MMGQEWLEADFKNYINAVCINLDPTSIYNSRCIDITCISFGVEKEELLSKTRKGEIIALRRLLYDYMRSRGNFTYQTIAKKFKKDHATVMHALRAHDNLLETNDTRYTNMYYSFRAILP